MQNVKSRHTFIYGIKCSNVQFFFCYFSYFFHEDFTLLSEIEKKSPAIVFAKRLTTGLEETVLKDVFKAWKKHEYAWFKFSRIG